MHNRGMNRLKSRATFPFWVHKMQRYPWPCRATGNLEMTPRVERFFDVFCKLFASSNCRQNALVVCASAAGGSNRRARREARTRRSPKIRTKEPSCFPKPQLAASHQSIRLSWPSYRLLKILQNKGTRIN